MQQNFICKPPYSINISLIIDCYAVKLIRSNFQEVLGMQQANSSGGGAAASPRKSVSSPTGKTRTPNAAVVLRDLREAKIFMHLRQIPQHELATRLQQADPNRQHPKENTTLLNLSAALKGEEVFDPKSKKDITVALEYYLQTKVTDLETLAGANLIGRMSEFEGGNRILFNVVRLRLLSCFRNESSSLALLECDDVLRHVIHISQIKAQIEMELGANPIFVTKKRERVSKKKNDRIEKFTLLQSALANLMQFLDASIVDGTMLSLASFMTIESAYLALEVAKNNFISCKGIAEKNKKADKAAQILQVVRALNQYILFIGQSVQAMRDSILRYQNAVVIAYEQELDVYLAMRQETLEALQEQVSSNTALAECCIKYHATTDKSDEVLYRQLRTVPSSSNPEFANLRQKINRALDKFNVCKSFEARLKLTLSTLKKYYEDRFLRLTENATGSYASERATLSEIIRGGIFKLPYATGFQGLFAFNADGKILNYNDPEVIALAAELLQQPALKVMEKFRQLNFGAALHFVTAPSDALDVDATAVPAGDFLGLFARLNCLPPQLAVDHPTIVELAKYLTPNAADKFLFYSFCKELSLEAKGNSILVALRAFAVEILKWPEFSALELYVWLNFRTMLLGETSVVVCNIGQISKLIAAHFTNESIAIPAVEKRIAAVRHVGKVLAAVSDNLSNHASLKLDAGKLREQANNRKQGRMHFAATISGQLENIKKSLVDVAYLKELFFSRQTLIKLKQDLVALAGNLQELAADESVVRSGNAKATVAFLGNLQRNLGEAVKSLDSARNEIPVTEGVAGSSLTVSARVMQQSVECHADNLNELIKTLIDCGEDASLVESLGKSNGAHSTVLLKFRDLLSGRAEIAALPKISLEKMTDALNIFANAYRYKHHIFAAEVYVWLQQAGLAKSSIGDFVRNMTVSPFISAMYDATIGGSNRVRAELNQNINAIKNFLHAEAVCNFAKASSKDIIAATEELRGSLLNIIDEIILIINNPFGLFTPAKYTLCVAKLDFVSGVINSKYKTLLSAYELTVAGIANAKILFVELSEKLRNYQSYFSDHVIDTEIEEKYNNTRRSILDAAEELEIKIPYESEVGEKVLYAALLLEIDRKITLDATLIQDYKNLAQKIEDSEGLEWPVVDNLHKLKGLYTQQAQQCRTIIVGLLDFIAANQRDSLTAEDLKMLTEMQSHLKSLFSDVTIFSEQITNFAQHIPLLADAYNGYVEFTKMAQDVDDSIASPYLPRPPRRKKTVGSPAASPAASPAVSRHSVFASTVGGANYAASSDASSAGSAGAESAADSDSNATAEAVAPHTP